MIPSGAPVTDTIAALVPLMSAGDVIIDGGNSYYRDSVRRAEELAEKRLQFVDCGTSGGVWGLENGYCLMVGGEREVVERLKPVFTTLAPVDGWLHVGPAGAGHFVKMVHNGIEYGMLQAYGEGFELLNASRYELDLPRISALVEPGERRAFVAAGAGGARIEEGPWPVCRSRDMSRTPERGAGR